MASFAIASNTAWSFFMDRDNGIFYEMLTYPMSRGQYLFGKVLFNVAVALVQALITVASGRFSSAFRCGSLAFRCCLLVSSSAPQAGFSSTPSSRSGSAGMMRLTPSRRLLFHLPLRELDVLSARSAAAPLSDFRLRQSHHVAGRYPALCHDRLGNASTDPDGRRGVRRLFCDLLRLALHALHDQE
jgi:hypothetical protein